jgi:hypothetical protein
MSDDEPRENRLAAEPTPDPGVELSDPHRGPLDDDDDARYLDPADERRLEVERRRGRPFNADEED